MPKPLYLRTLRMNEFRRDHRRKPQQAMDGILNAPSRPQLTGRPFARRSLGGDSFNATPRTVGDFKRSQGYHAANSPMTAPRRGQAMQKKEIETEDIASLHMTLPGGKKHGRSHRKEEKAQTGKRDWRKIRKRTLKGGAIFMALLLIVGGFLFAKGYIKLHKVFKGGGSAAADTSSVNPRIASIVIPPEFAGQRTPPAEVTQRR